MFCALALVFLASGLYSLMPEAKDAMILIEYGSAVFVIAFCIIVIFKNHSSIEDRGVKIVCRTIAIVAFAICPFSIVAIFSPSFMPFMVPVVFLGFGIAIMVFLFIAISREDGTNAKATEDVKSREVELSDLRQYHITEREFGVITLIGKGMTNKEIASELGLSVNTVNNHIANIFSKTGVRSRIDLLNLIHQGW